MEAPSDAHTSSIQIFPGEGQEHVLRILESITDGFYSFDSEWRFTFINEAGKRMLAENRVNPDELLGRNYWEEFPATRETLVGQEFERAVTDCVDVDFEAFYPPWNRWFAVRGYPIRGGGLSVYFRDVSKEKAAAAALRASEERYRSLFHSIDEGFCVVEMIWDEQGRAIDYRFVEVNAAFQGQTGLQNAVGHTARELVPGLEDEWVQVYGKVARTGEATHFVMGSEPMERWFDVYAFPINAGSERHVAIRCQDITERRRTEKEMVRLSMENRSRVEELETLLDVLPIGIAISSDPECRHIRLNKAFSKVLEVPQDANGSKTAPTGQAPANFKAFDDFGNEISSENLPMQIAAREGREIRDFEMNIVHTDGRQVRLLEYVAPIFNEAGEPRGSVGAFLDITERRQAEQRQKFLLELDDAVRPLSNAEDIVAVSARLLGQLLNVDRCAYADIEADQDSMQITGDYTRGVPSIVGRFSFTQFGAEVLRLMRANEVYVVEDIQSHQPPPEDLGAYHATLIRAVICVPLHKEGKLVAAMAVHMQTPRRWTQEEVSLLLHVANRCWEALERSRVTRAVRESEERFRQIADLMPQVVWLARPDGYVDYYNRRWYEYTGLPPGEVGYTSWLSVMHAEDVQPSSERWRHSVESGDFYETRYRWRDQATGVYRWFLGRGVPLRDDRGDIVCWYGTSTDIDDVVRAEETAREARAEAERANRAKDDFLAALSHELRTPLTPVLMAAEDLSEDPTLPAALRETLSMMRRNITLEARLIDDLLDLTRITHGKLSLRLQEADAHSLMGLALDIVRDEAQAKNLTIEVEFKAHNTLLHCDPARLQQVFWNLLKNAVKFTPTRGSIHIRSRDDCESIVMEVTDTGIGLAPETIEHVFLPFEQAGLANDHRFGGLGLGLSISKAIVDMHGGRISAESRGAGLGSTFRVDLLGKKNLHGKDSVHADTPTGSGVVSEKEAHRFLRLLVVEDHEPTLAVLGRLLKRAGHTVFTANSVAAALELAENNKFDVVVSDIGLPDGTGIELMKTLNAQHGLRGIALSGYGMEEDQRQAYDAGFVAHLTKPVDFAQLRRVLGQVTA